jgi:hypothetical protein
MEFVSAHDHRLPASHESLPDPSRVSPRARLPFASARDALVPAHQQDFSMSKSSKSLVSRCQLLPIRATGIVDSRWKRRMEKLRIIAEYFEFLTRQKKWWLLPIVILLLLFGVLVIFTESSPLAAFIYTIF